LFAGTLRGGVFRSINDGLAWTPVAPLPSNLPINSLAAGGTTLLAGTPQGVFRTSAGGLVWSKDTPQPSDPRINCLAVSSTAFLAGTPSAGIWRYPQ
jgi:hypothetical protein